ncbi:hypothetical protein EV183_002550 [Coemansia sp. RSA 2336]|nr:hypothetical protein EV183_002550 [Coemansia sp. RSA 2336]
MSVANSQGIHTLLEAEKSASEIVDQARAYRIEHLKEARKMATQAITELQERKNGELAKIQQESTNHSELEQSIKEDTDKKMAAIKEQFEKNKQEAVDKLVSVVTDPTL